MSEKNLKIIENIEKEIARIEKKENKIYFFVIDTKGVPSGSLKYIYNLALMLKEDGYDVVMLHTEDEFIGVESWLGEEYANLPHENVNKGEISTTPADVLFIPEIFSQVMNQTRNLPCKRVIILQNYDYVVEQMPYSVQLGDFGILEGITNSNFQASQLNESFPYVKLTKVTPFISKAFGDTDEPKDMVVGIVAKDQSDIKKVVKPFYWKYPMFKWVSFKDLRNMSESEFAAELRKCAVTVVIDETASFCYSALEAMASGSLTICKVPTTELDWAITEDGSLPNCCVWFNDYDTLHKQLASVVRSWITDKVPQVIKTESAKTLSAFSETQTANQIKEYVKGILDRRVKEMKELITNQVKNKEDK